MKGGNPHLLSPLSRATAHTKYRQSGHLQDRTRSETRDLYDLGFLTSQAGIEIGDLVEAITEKLCFRTVEIAGLEDCITAKEARLRTLWNSRLEHQVEALPQFDEVYLARFRRREFAPSAAAFVRTSRGDGHRIRIRTLEVINRELKEQLEAAYGKRAVVQPKLGSCTER